MSLRRYPNAEIRVWSRALASVGLASVLSIAGCAVGPKYNRPAVEVPPAYKETGDWKPAQPNEQNLGGVWWQIFQDQQLNALEDQINVSNQNLKAAEAQYTQARAVLRYYRADYYPSINAGDASERPSNRNAIGRKPVPRTSLLSISAYMCNSRCSTSRRAASMRKSNS
jgi:outer membrane protein TolC